MEPTGNWEATLWLCLMLNLPFPPWACPAVTLKKYQQIFPGDFAHNIMVEIQWPKSGCFGYSTRTRFDLEAYSVRMARLGLSVINVWPGHPTTVMRWSRQLYAKAVRSLEPAELIASREFLESLGVATDVRTADIYTKEGIKVFISIMLNSDVLINRAWPAVRQMCDKDILLKLVNIYDAGHVDDVKTRPITPNHLVELSYLRQYFPFTVHNGELLNEAGFTVGNVDGVPGSHHLSLSESWAAGMATITACLAGREFTNLFPETARLLELCGVK